MNLEEYKGVYVFAQQVDNEISSIAFELLGKAKDLAKVAGNKTEEVVELTRLKIQASQLRGDIDANYLKLGEMI